ncbi:MAG: glycogen/starch/alpha-glucan phosphorylase [Propylenella sp.]
MEKSIGSAHASASDDPPAVGRPALREEDVEAARQAILAKLTLDTGKVPTGASDRDWFVAAALTARDRIVHHWAESKKRARTENRKRVYYLSLEFLIGRLLGEVLNNLQLTEPFHAALGDLGVNIDHMFSSEPDAALGNGGLGRLAACFMESMATLRIPAVGYGIRYDHGLFRQVIHDGMQKEYPETWLSFGNPWEFERPEIVYDIGFAGHVETTKLSGGGSRAVWFPGETVEAVAFDTPVVGWRGQRVNPLRLWSARAVDPLRLDAFNAGEHVAALTEQTRAEAISKVLYPGDETPAGQELRLRQEYFFVSASLQNLIGRHRRIFGDIRSLPDRAAIQLNDTHPAIAVAELMRILVDVLGIEWEEAWEITVRTLSYTNHTLLPEALESWPVPLFERMLPRHVQIIFQINARHLEAAVKHGASEDDLRSLSLIDETNGRRVRMGHLAFIGSHHVNGVSALHTELMRHTVFKDLHKLHPGRIVNKTNGVTFRRWLHRVNPRLTALIAELCGADIRDDPEGIRKFADYADDPGVQKELADIRLAKKAVLARRIAHTLNVSVNAGALFDVQIKRIHEYKRQLLNLLETIALYHAIRANPGGDWTPRVKIFGGKAAATYRQAKLIIRLANDVANVINNDESIRDLLKVAFLPNYNVSLAETIIPASDLSEQISTAGMEASGTGNMKLALNGALTIGTLDGANVEIREHVGAENIFIFGLRAEEVRKRLQNGHDAKAAIEASPALKETLGAIASGAFSPGEPDRYAPIVDALSGNDRFMLTADFDSYYETQRRLDALWREPRAWWATSIRNIANMAWFSSDRSIREYAEEIWNTPVPPPDDD